MPAASTNVCIYPFRTAVSFWGQTTWCNLTGKCPKRDCGSKRVNQETTQERWPCKTIIHIVARSTITQIYHHQQQCGEGYNNTGTQSFLLLVLTTITADRCSRRWEHPNTAKAAQFDWWSRSGCRHPSCYYVDVPKWCMRVGKEKAGADGDAANAEVIVKERGGAFGWPNACWAGAMMRVTM